MAAQKIEHFAGAGDVGKAEITREIQVAHDVGEDTECARDHDRGHDGEAVETVGEIHGVARSHDHEIRQQDVERPEIEYRILEER